MVNNILGYVVHRGAAFKWRNAAPREMSHFFTGHSMQATSATGAWMQSAWKMANGKWASYGE
jgi:hypothetical protein